MEGPTKTMSHQSLSLKKEHVTVLETNEILCNVCDKKFTSAKMLQSHMIIAHSTSNQTYKCDLCEKAFVAKQGLQNHEKTVHDEKREKEEFGANLVETLFYQSIFLQDILNMCMKT